MIDSAALISQAQSAYSTGAQERIAMMTDQRNKLSEDEARKAAQEFESFFIGQMLEYMSTDIDPNGTFGGGHAESVWRSMLNQEYGKEMAKSGTVGIADQVMRAMLAAQGEATAEERAAKNATDK